MHSIIKMCFNPKKKFTLNSDFILKSSNVLAKKCRYLECVVKEKNQKI